MPSLHICTDSRNCGNLDIRTHDRNHPSEHFTDFLSDSPWDLSLFLIPGCFSPENFLYSWRPGRLYQTASHAASLALARWHGWRPGLLLYQTASHAASLALARWHGWRQISLLYQTASHAHLDSAPLHLDVWLAPNKSKKGSTPSRRFLLFSGCFLFYPCMACSLAKVSF